MERIRPKQPIARQQPKADAPKERARQERAELHRKHLFISNYLKKPSATQAAIFAGYSPVNAHNQGSALLRDPYVKEKITSALERMQARSECSVEKIVGELMKLGMSNMSDYIRVDYDGSPQIDLSDLDPDQWAAIQEVSTEVEMRGPPDDQYPVKKVKIKLYDKGSALEKIAKYLGMFNGRKSGGQGQFDNDVPEQIVTNYSLQIGNANIVINPNQAQGGTAGSEAQVLTLPRA